MSVQRFEFPFFQELNPAQLQQVSPKDKDYETATFEDSGSGDVTGRLVPTKDVLIPLPAQPGSTSGCEPQDFVPASETEPEVALIQRGTCEFAVKAKNAQQAGYDAAIIFNEGQEGPPRSSRAPWAHRTSPYLWSERASRRARSSSLPPKRARSSCACSPPPSRRRADLQRHRRHAGGPRGPRSSSAPTSIPWPRAPASTTMAGASATILEVARQMSARHRADEPGCASRSGVPRSPGCSARPLRGEPDRQTAEQDRPEPQFRHARLAELRALRLRRRRLADARRP